MDKETINSNQDNTPKELTTDQWLKLAKLTQDNFFNRRQLEWRLSFAFWTAIASFTGVFLIKEREIQIGQHYYALAFAYFVFFISSVLLQYWIAYAHKGDKNFMFQRIDMALGKNTEEPVESERKRWDINMKWFLFHNMVSLLMLTGSWVLLRSFVS